MINFTTAFIFRNNGTFHLVPTASYDRDLSFQHFPFHVKRRNESALRNVLYFPISLSKTEIAEIVMHWLELTT